MSIVFKLGPAILGGVHAFFEGGNRDGQALELRLLGASINTFFAIGQRKSRTQGALGYNGSRYKKG